MSRYGDYSPAPERWDAERFSRERGGRQQTLERERFDERERYSGGDGSGGRRRESSADGLRFRPRPERGGGDQFKEDRFFSEERYGPPARRYGPERKQNRYYEEEEIDSFESSPVRGGGRMVPFDRRGPPRPGLLRRQSSLDTFDRKPMRRNPEPPRTPPEVIQVPPPRRRRSPPRYHEQDHEDIRIAEPDRYGDGDFRGWREREVETTRRRRPSPEQYREREKEEIKEFEGVEEEKPFPRKGRTKMSARLVNKRALVELGYPFEDEYSEEGDFVIILKALNKELIDDVLIISKEMNEKDRVRTTYMIEAPHPPPEPEIIERREIIIPAPPSEVPRSVREWDLMEGVVEKSEHGGGGKSHAGKSHASKSYAGRSEHKSEHKSSHRGYSEHGGGDEHSFHGGSTVKGGKSTHGGKSEHGKSEHHSEHKSSYSRRTKSRGGKSHAAKSESSSSSSSSSEAEIIIERKPRKSRSKSHGRSRSVSYRHEDAIEEIGESNQMTTGPLALVLPHRERDRRGSRDERKIREEIKELEVEKRRLREERKHEKKYQRERDEDEVIIERVHEGGRREKDVKVEKDRKGSDSRMMKAMLATLT